MRSHLLHFGMVLCLTGMGATGAHAEERTRSIVATCRTEISNYEEYTEYEIFSDGTRSDNAASVRESYYPLHHGVEVREFRNALAIDNAAESQLFNVFFQMDASRAHIAFNAKSGEGQLTVDTPDDYTTKLTCIYRR